MLIRLAYGIVAFFAAGFLAYLGHLLFRSERAPKEESVSLASYLPPTPESYGAFRARTTAEVPSGASVKPSDPSKPDSRGRVA
jgi:threonine/homoserine/homoserine lactone efflux protein